MKDQTEVCSLSRGILLSLNSIPISLITRELLLCPSSFVRISLGSPYRSLSLWGRDTDLPCSALMPRWVRPRLSAGDMWSTMREAGNPHTHHVPFGSSLSAPLACCPITTFISDSLLLAIPSNSSAPTASMLAVLASLTVLLSFVKRRATLSWKLPTPGLLQTQVPVEYWW